jgi:hypothetical protein
MSNRPSRGRNALLGLVIVAIAVNAILVARFLNYRRETARLREGMTEAQRQRTDAVVATERHRVRVELALIRRQARGDRQLHLSVNVDSSRMVLERDGVILREMNVRLGPERFTGVGSDSTISVNVLGLRTVERQLDEGDSWEVPAAIFQDRGLPVPETRRIKGALGKDALVLSEGTVVYAVPKEGPLADSSYVLPGSVQMSAEDLKALSANIKPGMPVYFYR